MLGFCRLTRWSPNDALNLTWQEMQEWLEDAIDLENEISLRMRN